MKILLIDDDENFVESLKLEFQDRGVDVFGFHSYSDITEEIILNSTHAIVDLRLKGENGLNILVSLREQNPDLQMIMLTGFGTISTAVEAMRLGAINYLSKPVSFDVLFQTLKNASSEEVQVSESEMTLAEKEREYIEYVLLKCEGNISKAAKILGLHRQSLQRMLKKYPFHRGE